MSRLSMCVSVISWIGVAALWLPGEIQDKTVIAWAVGWTLGFAWMQRARTIYAYLRRRAERLPVARVVGQRPRAVWSGPSPTKPPPINDPREPVGTGSWAEISLKVDKLAADVAALNERNVRQLNRLSKLFPGGNP